MAEIKQAVDEQRRREQHARDIIERYRYVQDAKAIRKAPWEVNPFASAIVPPRPVLPPRATLKEFAALGSYDGQFGTRSLNDELRNLDRQLAPRMLTQAEAQAYSEAYRETFGPNRR